jgi:hypothetical protein
MAAAANRIFDAQPQGFVAVSAVSSVSSDESLSLSAPRRRSPSHWGRHQQTRSLSRNSQDGDGGRDELCSYHINCGCKAERRSQPRKLLGKWGCHWQRQVNVAVDRQVYVIPSPAQSFSGLVLPSPCFHTPSIQTHHSSSTTAICRICTRICDVLACFLPIVGDGKGRSCSHHGAFTCGDRWLPHVSQGLLPGSAKLRIADPLLQAHFVLVHQDATKPAFAPLYSVPFWVLEQSVRFFCL